MTLSYWFFVIVNSQCTDFKPFDSAKNFQLKLKTTRKSYLFHKYFTGFSTNMAVVCTVWRCTLWTLVLRADVPCEPLSCVQMYPMIPCTMCRCTLWTRLLCRACPSPSPPPPPPRRPCTAGWCTQTTPTTHTMHSSPPCTLWMSLVRVYMFPQVFPTTSLLSALYTMNVTG